MNQTPYGGGGFPSPWLRNSAQTDNESGVEWEDPSPSSAQESDSGAQEPFPSTWDGSGDSGAGEDYLPPAPESAPYSGRFNQVDGSESVHPEEGDSSNNFDSILEVFSGAHEVSDPRGQPKKKRASRPPRSSRKQRTPQASSWAALSSKKVLLPICLIVGIALLGGAGFFAFDHYSAKPGQETTATQNAGEEISREAPSGWEKTASWTSQADVASDLAVRNDYVAYLNTSGVLVVLDAKSGENVFSSTPTGADPEESQVAITQLNETPVVAVIENESVTAWALDEDTPEPKSNDIPSSASVTSDGSGIMVNADGETWRISESLGLEKVEGLPKGNVSLGLTPEGDVISGSPKGGWGVNDGKKTSKVKVEMAEGAEGKVMYPARAAKGIVIAWAPTSDKNTRAVGAYDAQEGSVIATTKMDTAQVNLGLPLTVADGGELASAGPWLIDLKRGETETVSGWGTSIGTSVGLYGKTADGKFVWRGSGEPEAVAQNAATPWGITPDGEAVIISTDADGKKVIAALNKKS